MPQGLRAGLDIRWRTWGSGPAPLLMLHCGLGNSGLWTPVAEAVGDLFHCTAPDWPGHGRSAPFRDDQSVHDQAAAVAGSFLEEGHWLIGHSFGATVALRLAMEQRSRIAGLVLIESVFFAAAKGTAAWDAHDAERRVWTDRWHAGDRTGGARGFHAQWGDGPWEDIPPAVQDRMAARMGFVIASETGLADDPAGLLAPGRLEALDLPVVLIRGSQSRKVIAAVQDALARRLRHCRSLTVDGAGHMVPVTHPEPVVAALRGLQ